MSAGGQPHLRPSVHLERVPGEFALPCHHPQGNPGEVDERLRRVDHEELAVGQLFGAEGHNLRSMPHLRKLGRQADWDACGWRVEVKSLAGNEEGPPTAVDVANQILRGRGQGHLVTVYSTGSGLTQHQARRGLDLARERLDGFGWGGICGVRLVGDGYDLSFSARKLWAEARPGPIPRPSSSVALYPRPRREAEPGLPHPTTIPEGPRAQGPTPFGP
jgi:hypothetical protein